MTNPVFTQQADGSVTVDRFTPSLLITRQLLEAANPTLVQRSFRLITFTVANGSATYRLRRYNRQLDYFEARRVA